MAFTSFKQLLSLQGWKEIIGSKPETEAYYRAGIPSGQRNYINFSMYDGEKNLGGIGPVEEYFLEHESLRARGYKAYLTNESVQTIINKLVVWTIGRGLKLDTNPNFTVLNSEGISLSKEKAQEISELIEARFALYKESKFSTFSKMKNLSQMETTCFKNAKNGGDVLVLLRYQNDWVNVELVDGAHVRSPRGGNDWNPQVLENGNRIVNGVELNEEGEHVAYWIQDASLVYKRVEARSKVTGLTTAYLVGGLEYRLDNVRCIPALSGLFEVLATMDRYKSATIATAEEQAKVVYQIKHGSQSTGDNPLIQQVALARDTSKNDGTIPTDIQLVQMANKVAVSTEKQVINNVVDSEILPLDKNKGELYFKDFYGVFFDLVCAAIGMPPNVAMAKYDTSFSSARAAIKDWEHSLLVDRYNFAMSFLQPIYEFWLHMEVLKNKITLPGYIEAYRKKNQIVLECYRQCSWVGDNVPHIDPVKEVMAERLKLGNTSDSIPLTTVEAATKVLNGGESRANIQQYGKELQETKKNGIEIKQPPVNQNKGKVAAYEDLFRFAFMNEMEN